MATIQAVRSAIKTKLETLKGTNKPFVNVYNFFTEKTTGYPFAMFEPLSLQSEFTDTDNNYRTFVFKIYIVQEMNKIVRSDALEILLNCFEQMINAFDEDWTLSGVVQEVEASQGGFLSGDFESGPCLAVEVNLSCRVLVSIS